LTEIRFGVVIPQGWSYDLPRTTEMDLQQQIKCRQASMQYGFSKNISKAVDHSSGFDSLYTYDHFLPYYAPNNKNDFFECFTLLSSIAALTSKVKLGQVVTCNSYRNPALLAKMLSTLDIISNGRLELGIGAGWHEEEYRQYGYDFLSSVVRIEHAGSTQSDIANFKNLSAPTINWHMSRLIEAGIVIAHKEWKTVQYFIKDPESLTDSLKSYFPTVWNNLSDRFAKLFIQVSTGRRKGSTQF